MNEIQEVEAHLSQGSAARVLLKRLCVCVRVSIYVADGRGGICVCLRNDVGKWALHLSLTEYLLSRGHYAKRCKYFEVKGGISLGNEAGRLSACAERCIACLLRWGGNASFEKKTKFCDCINTEAWARTLWMPVIGPFPQIRQQAIEPRWCAWNAAVANTHRLVGTLAHTHNCTKQGSVSPWQQVKQQNEIHSGWRESTTIGRLRRRSEKTRSLRLRSSRSRELLCAFCYSSSWTWWHHTHKCCVGVLSISLKVNFSADSGWKQAMTSLILEFATVVCASETKPSNQLKPTSFLSHRVKQMNFDKSSTVLLVKCIIVSSHCVCHSWPADKCSDRMVGALVCGVWMSRKSLFPN